MKKQQQEHKNENICEPQPWEKNFYMLNSIPFWKGEKGDICDVGTIWENKTGSYIKATVVPLPEQHWEFTVFCAENNFRTIIKAGPGDISMFYDTMKLMAENKICITESEIVT